MTNFAPSVPADFPRTLSALVASGYQSRTVKQEMQANLLTRLREGVPSLPGIVGFEDTVIPQVERSILAGHDLVLLGERGQGKTRLIRTLTQLLDEWIPVVEGCEINDDPLEPICAGCRRQAAELGDDLPVSWRHRSQRFGEKLATPDTSVADLIGDVDPVKVAEGRSLGDPETVHYGLVPRTNRASQCLGKNRTNRRRNFRGRYRTFPLGPAAPIGRRHRCADAKRLRIRCREHRRCDTLE